MADTIRKEVLALPQYKNLRKKVLAPSALGTGDNAAPIRALVLGPDLYVAAQIAEKGAAALRKVTVEKGNERPLLWRVRVASIRRVSPRRGECNGVAFIQVPRNHDGMHV